MKSMLQLYKAQLFKPMHAVNSAALGHPKLTQLFDRYATYNGSNPYKAPGTLTVIPTLEHRWGTFLPEGGMQRITDSLYELCCDLGVAFEFNAKVEEILTDNGRISGIKAVGKSIAHDLVVSNMDVYPTYNHLLKSEKMPKAIKNQERSSSALIFYWGIKREFRELGLHNILWSADYEEEFRMIFEEKNLHSDPTVYINITSKHLSGDAPPGCENWFVMVNAPHEAAQDWAALRQKMRAAIIAKINRVLGCDLAPLIITERVLDPPGIESQTSSHLGSLYGTSSNSRLSAFFRHPNFSQKIKNLYFCGGSVHPGGGIPLCLLSGKIVSELAG
jgi:phytoene desaturase